MLAKRLAVTRGDPVRALKVHDAVRALLTGLAGALGGPDHLLTLVSSHASPRLALHVNAVLNGNLGPLLEAEEEARGGSGAGNEDDDDDGPGFSSGFDDEDGGGARGRGARGNTTLLADLSE